MMISVQDSTNRIMTGPYLYDDMMSTEPNTVDDMAGVANELFL
jgi:hypothetical protein